MRELVTTLNDVFAQYGRCHRGPLFGSDGCRYAEPARADEAAGVYRQGHEEPHRQDRSRSARMSRPSAEYLQGLTLLAYSDDPVAAPKVATEFAKCQPEKLKDSRRGDGGDSSGREWCEGPCLHAPRWTELARHARGGSSMPPRPKIRPALHRGRRRSLAGVFSAYAKSEGRRFVRNHHLSNPTSVRSLQRD